MGLPYLVVDVFAEQPFGGNPLAVIPDGRGLSSEQMQRVAQAFNLSETTFVLPPEQGQTRRVRIFTPQAEMPFAGHPNIGTACALAAEGLLGDIDASLDIVFEQPAGHVPITVRREGRNFAAELRAPQAFATGNPVSAALAAAALGLDESALSTTAHPPISASAGLPFLCVELAGAEALAAVTPSAAAFGALADAGEPTMVHAYVRGEDESQISCRMLAPLDGVPEDPATGSANCALAGLLASLDPRAEGELGWRITQGVEMGRPSVLHARVEKRAGAVETIRVGGATRYFARGQLTGLTPEG